MQIRIHMDIFKIPDPHNNRCGSETLVTVVIIHKHWCRKPSLLCQVSRVLLVYFLAELRSYLKA